MSAGYGHDCFWRRCVCRGCGDPSRNRDYMNKLRRAGRFRERAAWRRDWREHG